MIWIIPIIMMFVFFAIVFNHWQKMDEAGEDL